MQARDPRELSLQSSDLLVVVLYCFIVLDIRSTPWENHSVQPAEKPYRNGDPPIK